MLPPHGSGGKKSERRNNEYFLLAKNASVLLRDTGHGLVGLGTPLSTSIRPFGRSLSTHLVRLHRLSDLPTPPTKNPTTQLWSLSHSLFGSVELSLERVVAPGSRSHQHSHHREMPVLFWSPSSEPSGIILKHFLLAGRRGRVNRTV